MLVLNLLGSVRIAFPDEARPLLLPRQATRLLAWLALHRRRGHGREELMERFWPDQAPDRARSALASAVFRLRHALPEGARELISVSQAGAPELRRDAPLSLDFERFALSIGPALAWPDAVLPAPLRAKLERALELYRGDLLCGWYEDWVLQERERLRILRLTAQQRLLEHRAASGDAEGALALGRVILEQEPLHEQVHRRMMEILAGRGERARALLLYRDLERRLAAELGVAPDPVTRALRERLSG